MRTKYRLCAPTFHENVETERKIHSIGEKYEKNVSEERAQMKDGIKHIIGETVKISTLRPRVTVLQTRSIIIFTV